MLAAVSIFVFLTIGAGCLLMHRLFFQEKAVVRYRMEQYVKTGKSPSPVTAAARTAGWKTAVRWFSRYAEFPHWSRMIEHKLMQGGVPMRGAEFTVICLGGGLGFAFLLLLISGSPFAGLLGLITGFAFPVIILHSKIQKRMKAFNGQLGDALILVANSLRTGYSFMQALEMVSREMPKPISEEFGKVLKEMNLGVTTETAMNNMAKRMNSDDLDLVITAVLIQRQVGGNLSEVLDNIAGTIRERVRIKGHIQTLTAQGRISGIIISLLPIAIGSVIFLLNPQYITLLFTHPIGRLMLVAGVASQLIGVLFIRRIVDIDV